MAFNDFYFWQRKKPVQGDYPVIRTRNGWTHKMTKVWLTSTSSQPLCLWLACSCYYHIFSVSSPLSPSITPSLFTPGSRPTYFTNLSPQTFFWPQDSLRFIWTSWFFVLVFFIIFWATVCKTVHCMLSDRCLSVLFVTFVHCGQTVGRIKMKLGTQVGLGPSHIVLDGDPAPPPPKGHSPLPNFRPISIAAKRLHGSRCHLVWI